MEEPVILGQKIKNVRKSTKKELQSEGWTVPFQVIVLENGVKLYASRDDEGNESGALFGQNKLGKTFGVW